MTRILIYITAVLLSGCYAQQTQKLGVISAPENQEIFNYYLNEKLTPLEDLLKADLWLLEQETFITKEESDIIRSRSILLRCMIRRLEDQ